VVLLPGPGGGRGPMAILRESEKPKGAWKTLKRLGGSLLGQRWMLALVGILVIVSSVTDLMGPYLMGQAIDRFITKGDLPGLARLLVLMVAVYAVSAGGVWLQNFVMAGVAQRVVRDLRRELFSRLQRLPVRFFDRRPHGDLMSRFTNDIENISNVLAAGFSQLISSVFGLAGVIVVMVVLNRLLALVSLVVMPLTYLLTRLIVKYTRRGFRETQKNLGSLNGIIEETVTGQKTVKAFVHEQTVIGEFTTANQALRRSALKARIFSSFMGPLMNMVNYLGLAVVACAGGLLAVAGRATVGEIASFVGYSGRLGHPLNAIANLFTTIQSALAGAERVFELMDEQPETEAPDAAPLDAIVGSVVFEDVDFSYEPGVPVLQNVSLCTEPGQVVALVGPTGAGKTTIANLLTRFYDVDGGAIRVDGRDVRGVRKDHLRRKTGLVLQDNFLFADTVMENIRYGRLEAGDEEVVAAAHLANADTFIHRLPHGYRTVLTERGSNLSQGQRQLLAIARAVLADPDVLILDEATSNVDTRTEKHLQEALLRLMKGRTSFVIAHRLSTIRDADQVLVIDHGRIIERGDHETLLAQRGFYHRLYMSQFKGHAEPEETASTS
jgi:ATP-binding cassette subfamily B multidrug efflux pump